MLYDGEDFEVAYSKFTLTFAKPNFKAAQMDAGNEVDAETTTSGDRIDNSMIASRVMHNR